MRDQTASTRAAYLGVIFIWSTTPLAVKWSSEGAGYLFAVAARMLLSLLVIYMVLWVLRRGIPRSARALKTYLVCGFGMYAAMTCIYWASQHIPSGWIAVVFGLSPIMTGVMAAALLNEDALRPHKVIGMLLGVAGLAVVCENGLNLGRDSFYGIAVLLAGSVFYSLSAVLIKRIDAQISGLVTTAGGLTVAVPLYLATWALAEGSFPGNLTAKAVYAILYLAVAGSVVGFALYYYILIRMAVSRVSLITLVTPVCALLLGRFVNHEPLSALIVMGAFLIVLGLFSYEFGNGMAVRISRFRTQTRTRSAS